MLAEGEQLDEGLFPAQARDDLAGRTLGPLIGRRIGLDLAFVLFAPMHRTGRRAQTFEGDEPAVGRVALAHPAGVAAAEDVTVRSVQIVVDDVLGARWAERAGSQSLELEQGGEHGRIGYRVLGFNFHGASFGVGAFLRDRTGTQS